MSVWALEIVGGPFDGVGGNMDVGSEPLPEKLWVGLCSGDGQCVADQCPGQRHAGAWFDEDPCRPPDAIPYTLRHWDDVTHVAVYAFGGLEPTLSAFDAEAPVEQAHPLVTT